MRARLFREARRVYLRVVSQLSSAAQRLRHALQRKLEGAIPSEAELNEFGERAAKLFVAAMGDPQHVLRTEFENLAAAVGLGASEPPPKMAYPHLFSPQPGMISHPMRAFWKLQLLLYAAVRSPYCPQLAEALKIPEEQLKSASEAARAMSVARWSRRQCAVYLEQALDVLELADPRPRVEGQLLYHMGERVKLGEQQAIFLRLLLENAGTLVLNKTLKTGGVTHPASVKHDLEMKLKKNHIELQILGRPGGYMLVPDE